MDKKTKKDGNNKNKESRNIFRENHHRRYHLKYKICVSGSAETGNCSEDAIQKAESVGREIAKRGLVLITGATTGMPYWAAKGAKEAGGIVIGFSPAASKAAHIKTYHLPIDYHDLIVYTGFDYGGRNLLLVRAADAVITLCGRIGTLNEFTIAFEDHKPVGILEGAGGTTDMIYDILKKAHRGFNDVVFNSDPDKLLDEVLEIVKKREKKLGVDF